MSMIKKEDFGADFLWGITQSAFQNEGYADADGKGKSIWDTFTANPSNIKNGDIVGDACSFYTNYPQDIALAASFNFDVFRFSTAWTRIQPNGYGSVNSKGIDYYNRVIDSCLEKGLTPWVTLYHWDLPQALEDLGGWANRDIVDRFSEFTSICSHHFGDRVKHWVVMNEPMSFVGLGYFRGYHAPQRTGVFNFLAASHHALLAMGEAARTIKEADWAAEVGPALSCSYVEPKSAWFLHQRAARKAEAMLNRFFLEPVLGLGYPVDTIAALRLIDRYVKEGDMERIAFPYDFIGLQYYFRVVAKFSLKQPFIFAEEVLPTERKAKLNDMNLDAYTKGMRHVLEFYAGYPQIKKLIITESGVCFKDTVVDDSVDDKRRIKYHKKMLKHVKRAIQKGINVKGYFVWTLVDNFEWKEGYEPRFGLVYYNSQTKQRIVKASGKWFRKFLKRRF